MRDVWMWVAEYRANDAGQIETVPEVIYGDGEEIERGWSIVDQDRVTALYLYPRDSGTGLEPLMLTLPDGAKPILFRRRTLALMSSTPDTTTCIGWKAPGASCYLWVGDNGRVACTPWDELAPVER